MGHLLNPNPCTWFDHCPLYNSDELGIYTVLDLWENQRGVSNVFLTDFDYLFGGQYKLGGLRGTRGGLNPPTPQQIEHCIYTNIVSWVSTFSMLFVDIVSTRLDARCTDHSTIILTITKIMGHIINRRRVTHHLICIHDSQNRSLDSKHVSPNPPEDLWIWRSPHIFMAQTPSLTISWAASIYLSQKCLEFMVDVRHSIYNYRLTTVTEYDWIKVDVEIINVLCYAGIYGKSGFDQTTLSNNVMSMMEEDSKNIKYYCITPKITERI